ncbi:UDP-glucose 4-epimerase [Oceanobacillus zhaokaii]|uniref:UDP-glucose 4-epimerase n=1 Tax=Oceanobacillus zhaokaii TaxID=2052660 RepID=A0A345PL28_9BACI|nr:NAD-dependent epimerase/dehydratase family protein [Oceanobacillus zhaokaii]AXI10708.1 UDP-glucose 4-epimerase [Oceanobacillus zhaokaii]
MKRILVTGALGQIGTELVNKLRDVYGTLNVIATDIRADDAVKEKGPIELVDVTDGSAIFQCAVKYRVDTIIHLASILSAKAETAPRLAWDVNMVGLINAIEVARELDLQFFTPSSIGAFGPSTPKNNTPQVTLQRPTTMYGISKVAGELLCDYYFKRFGVDTRGLRFPGLISYLAPPGGGTTDYAVEIYYHAVKNKTYKSYIAEGTAMDMMYMPDALNAIITLMEANPEKLVHRNAYNVSSFSAAPEDFARVIKKHIPAFTLDYQVDPIRQSIADSWPNVIDCSEAVSDWKFRVEYDLEKLSKDMLAKIKRDLGK